ncbi:DNA polymerase interacting tetratricopeptide repeat-containing, protein of 47 kDa-like [Ornithodoros turicata]|uniref:DNA polymerase interacting tetratricopeptide repeat-containing, protein of 47 kDa-like n=1 Tax=Ornithodoros turicata TaxID=34597 RepID=UPI003139C9DB
MDPESRQKLIEQLEKESEEYLASLKPKKYKDGWKEDTWEQEMEEHPLFATKLPENAEMPPLLEAMQQLKYDTETNSPEGLAEQYKADGNNNFRLKKYRWAVASYTEGIKQKCSNTELNAQLFCNRSAAHFRLENHGSALADALRAIKLKPGYVKAMTKAAMCCAELRKWQSCQQLCQEILKEEPENAAVKELFNKASEQKKIAERDERRELQKKKLQDERNAALKAELMKRGINLQDEESDDTLRPVHPALADHTVHFADDKQDLVWPVIFLYPEFMDSDYIQRFCESNTFEAVLQIMFGEGVQQPEWNADGRYAVGRLSIWYKGIGSGALVQVSPNSTLKEVVFDKRFVVHNGTPTFCILSRGSEFEAKYISEHGKW